MKYLLCEKGLHTVCASYFTGNDASRRVMEKCGMAYDRFSEKELTYLGVERDLTYYAIRKEPSVLLLNGPSSAGKSSIAKASLQYLYPKTGYDLCVDSGKADAAVLAEQIVGSLLKDPKTMNGGIIA